MISISGLILTFAIAQSPAPAPAPEQASPQPSPPAEEAKPAPKPEPLPDLDELLGLPKADKPASGEPVPRPEDAIRTELDRRLLDKQIDDNFKRAIQMMADVATRLASARDAGIETQRTQEEIIKRLDALIESAKEQESQQSQSQSQSQSQREQQQQPTRQQQQQQQDRKPAGQENVAEATPPGGRTGALNKEALDAAVAAWGALPERARDSLLQGMGDTFSSLYDAMTQEYYRRLAEEKPRE